MKVMQMEDIDWDYWLDLTSVHEWEACGLSLGINPKSIKRDFVRNRNSYVPKFYYEIRGVSPEVVNQFVNRLDIIQNNKYSNHFVLADTKVYLEKFVRWAITKNSFKDMPPELLSLVKPKDDPKSKVISTVEDSKIYLRERKYTEFEDEKKKFKTWLKCAEHYGISRQLYDNYRKFADTRDNPKSLTNHILSRKITKK